MNTFSLSATFRATTTDAREIHARFEAFLHQQGYLPPDEPCEILIVQRTNFLVGDIIWEIWVHQGEDGPGIIDICRDEEAAQYEVMRLQMTGTPLEKQTVHSRQVTVTQAWLDEYYETDPTPELATP